MNFPDKSGDAVPQKKIQPVIDSAVKMPRPVTRRFMEFLFAESPKALVKRIGTNIIVPRLKAGFEESANSFLAGALWGPGASQPSSILHRGVVTRTGTNYNAISQIGTPSSITQARQNNETRGVGNYQDLCCDTQERAELLLAGVFDLMERYRIVSVADVYELASISPDLSDDKYGWTSLDGARISKVREGFLVELPRPHII